MRMQIVKGRRSGKKQSWEHKEAAYRAGMPEMPVPIKMLPVDHRGYPVPWFVAKQKDGTYDLRVADRKKVIEAVREHKCWVCGQPVGDLFAFVIGPMCAVNRINSEPPAHIKCAEWSAKACPFLTQQEKKRREGGFSEKTDLPPGIPIMRQPGVVCIWICNQFTMIPERGDYLFKLGDPVEVRWFREARTASREEILESIDSGYPILFEQAEKDGAESVVALSKALTLALTLVPQS